MNVCTGLRTGSDVSVLDTVHTHVFSAAASVPAEACRGSVPAKGQGGWEKVLGKCRVQKALVCRVEERLYGNYWRRRHVYDTACGYVYLCT